MYRDEQLESAGTPDQEIANSSDQSAQNIETDSLITDLEERIEQQGTSTAKIETTEAREIAAHQAELETYASSETEQSQESYPTATTKRVPELSPAVVPTLEPEQAEAAAMQLAKRFSESDAAKKEVISLLKRIAAVAGGPYIVERTHDLIIEQTSKEQPGESSTG